MNTKVLRGLLFVLVLVAVFSVGRAVWYVESLQTTVAIKTAMSVAQESSMDSVYVQLNQQLDRANELAKYCIFVAECSPQQARNAETLVVEEKVFLTKMRDYLKVRNEATAALDAEDAAKLASLKEDYFNKKDAVQEAAKTVGQDIKLDLPKDLKPILTEMF